MFCRAANIVILAYARDLGFHFGGNFPAQVEMFGIIRWLEKTVTAQDYPIT